MSKRTVVLVVLDGWGIGLNDESNAIYEANPQNINYIKANFPAGALQASGIAVGLPWNEEGNSEVGHLTMGAGKIIYQNYPRITLAIKNGSFAQNEVIKTAIQHVQKNNSALNLIGLASNANVHSSLEHLLELIRIGDEANIKVNLHLFTDGRDSPPQSATDTLNKLPKEKIGSLCGRYYGMDRDRHWDRTFEAYKIITGESSMPVENDIQKVIKESYEKNFFDEYLTPTIINPDLTVKDNDAVIFFNFREDRMRQLFEAFANPNFKEFPTKQIGNLFIATMIDYESEFSVPTLFPIEKVEVPLGKILSDTGRNQLRIAETEKYAHVTFFFNGLKEGPFKNEYRVLIPSRNIPRHDERPEMMAEEITARVIQSLEEGVFDFILVNYANPDMIAHTGNREATIAAIKIVDEKIGRIIKTVLEKNDILIITADHGNAEKIYDPYTGRPETQHDPSPVPIYIVANEFKKTKTPDQVGESEKITVGILADVAPTILWLMGIPQPKEMTGQNLMKLLY